MGNSASGDIDDSHTGAIHGHHPGDENDDDEDEYAAQFDGIDTLGYRVLGVQPNSPASEAGLVSFLDFIVGANQQMLLGTSHGLQVGQEYDDVDFPALLRTAATNHQTVELRTCAVPLFFSGLNSLEGNFLDPTQHSELIFLLLMCFPFLHWSLSLPLVHQSFGT